MCSFLTHSPLWVLCVCVHVDSLSPHVCCDSSKQYMAEAAALLDSRKKRKVEERTTPPPSKRISGSDRKRVCVFVRAIFSLSGHHGGETSSSAMPRGSHRSVREEGSSSSGHREKGRERRPRSRSRSHSREREGGSRKSVRYVRKEEKKSKKRCTEPFTHTTCLSLSLSLSLSLTHSLTHTHTHTHTQVTKPKFRGGFWREQGDTAAWLLC